MDGGAYSGENGRNAYGDVKGLSVHLFETSRVHPLIQIGLKVRLLGNLNSLDHC